jgi:dodecin
MPLHTTNQQEPQVHAHRTAKVIELVCSSTRSFEDAIQKGLADARQSMRGITGAHVESMTVCCEDGSITEYRVSLKIAFGIERTPASGDYQI